MKPVSEIISVNNLAVPDGRPLHGYDCSPDLFAELEEALRSLTIHDQPIQIEAAGFVFWAAEHIRAHFLGGKLTWAFIFHNLGLPEDQELGRELVERGLDWWRRGVRKSISGIRMFLYSLMAEGGIPEALLNEPGLYRDVVMGLMAEIESEGGLAAKHWAEQIAARWTKRLPQTFQGDDFRFLLADLVMSLVELRSKLPAELPENVAERWLIQYVPDWKSRIPLRMTPEIAETLIRPALQAKRDPISPTRPLCRRELRRDATGCWHGFLALDDIGWIPAQLFPEAKWLRLRLLPTAGSPLHEVGYSATPDPNGWRLHRFGVARGVPMRCSPYRPFSLAAFADGRSKGEAIIDPGLPFPTEAPSFWRAINSEEGVEATQLIPLAGAARTRSPCLWLLAPDDLEPVIDASLTLQELETAPDGFLWRISGKGTLSLGEKQYRIDTGAEEDAPEARLTALGNTLRGWRLDGHVPTFRGEPTLYGQIGMSPLTPVPDHELRRSTGRLLGSEIVEWVQSDSVRARLRLVRLPAATRFNLREDAPGQITFTAEGLEYGWRARLRAGEVETGGDSVNGSVQLTLEIPGMAPGLIWLRLSEPATGSTLNVQAAWPAQKGMILNPEGVRLAQNQAISVEALYGWRVIAPEGGNCDLVLHLVGQDAISLPVAGEGSLAAHLLLIRAMLAQGGPDAQLNLYLIVDGQEGSRLEIRRYHDQTVVKDGILHAGLKRDESNAPEETVLAVLLRSRAPGDLAFHAVDMNRPEDVKTGKTTASADLCTLLGREGGPWLIQSRFSERVQRAAVWIPDVTPHTSRGDRIKTYTEQWHQLVSDPENPGWEWLWQLILVAAQGGDAGVLDQVQALAQAPAALVALALRVTSEEQRKVLALDAAAPIFWPILPVSDFTEAVCAEHLRRRAKLSFLEDAEAEIEADNILILRIGAILTLRPELAGHFGKALMETGLLERVINSSDHEEILKSLLISDPADRLTEMAQEAGRRFSRLPDGVDGLTPIRNPLHPFGRDVQKVIDAPLVAAEMASGHRPMANATEKLTLINLRIVDPIYFDAALPAALMFCLEPSA